MAQKHNKRQQIRNKFKNQKLSLTQSKIQARPHQTTWNEKLFAVSFSKNVPGQSTLCLQKSQSRILKWEVDRGRLTLQYKTTTATDRRGYVFERHFTEEKIFEQEHIRRSGRTAICGGTSPSTEEWKTSGYLPQAFGSLIFSCTTGGYHRSQHL